jgi:hypothetical protein
MYHNPYVTYAVKVRLPARFESQARPPAVLDVVTVVADDVARPLIQLSFYRSLSLEHIVSIWNALERDSFIPSRSFLRPRWGYLLSNNFVTAIRQLDDPSMKPSSLLPNTKRFSVAANSL